MCAKKPTTDKKWACPECSRTFGTEQGCQDHARAVHGERDFWGTKIYRCSRCRRGYNVLGDMYLCQAQHMGIHPKPPPSANEPSELKSAIKAQRSPLRNKKMPKNVEPLTKQQCRSAALKSTATEHAESHSELKSNTTEHAMQDPVRFCSGRA